MKIVLNAMIDRIARWVSRHEVAAITIFMFVALSLGSAGVEITRINIRFALMSEELATRPWGLFPTINGYPYADYPVLFNLMSFFSGGCGHWINRWTLILPTLLLGCYTVAVTGAIGDRIQRGLGVYAVLFSLLSYEYLNIFLGFGIDVPVAAAAVTIVFFLLKYDFAPRALPIYILMLFLAFAVRGPFGLILCGAVSAGCLVAAGRWKSVLLYGLVGAATALLCAALAIWAVHRQGGETLWKDVMEWQISSRLGRDRIFYYFTNAVASFAPTTLFAVATLAMKRRELFKPPLVMLLGWLLLPLVLLSIPGGKHLRYMTPVLPAIALIAAYGYANPDGSPIARMMTWIVDLMSKYLYVLLMVATLATLLAVPMLPLRLKLYIPHWLAALAVLTLIQAALRKHDGDAMPLARVALLLTTFTALVLNPLDAALEGAELFTRHVESQRVGRLYFYRLGPDHDDLKYLYHMQPEKRKKVVYLSHRNSDPRRLLGRMYPEKDILQVLPDIREDDVIVLLKKYVPDLRKRIGRSGKTIEVVSPAGMRLGHREVVALHLK